MSGGVKPQRTMTMDGLPKGGRAATPAERQRAYRDRKRGGPPRGRWVHEDGRPYVSAAKRGGRFGISRNTQLKLDWLARFYPDLVWCQKSADLDYKALTPVPSESRRAAHP